MTIINRRKFSSRLALLIGIITVGTAQPSSAAKNDAGAWITQSLRLNVSDNLAWKNAIQVRLSDTLRTFNQILAQSAFDYTHHQWNFGGGLVYLGSNRVGFIHEVRPIQYVQWQSDTTTTFKLRQMFEERIFVGSAASIASPSNVNLRLRTLARIQHPIDATQIGSLWLDNEIYLVTGQSPLNPSAPWDQNRLRAGIDLTPAQRYKFSIGLMHQWLIPQRSHNYLLLLTGALTP